MVGYSSDVYRNITLNNPPIANFPAIARQLVMYTLTLGKTRGTAPALIMKMEAIMKYTRRGLLRPNLK